MPIQNATEADLSKTGEDRPQKNPWVRLFVYVVLIAAGVFIGWRVYQNKEKTAANQANQAAALMSRPVPVQVIGAEQKPMPIYLTGLGTVTPNFTVTVKARVSGELLPVKFTEGQEVKEGQTIMVIDPKPYQAALDQAKGTLAHDQALLKNAQAEVNRYKALYNAGVVSKESLEANEAQLGQYEGAIQSDNASIENAQLQLSWCYIKAPISGRIGLRLVDPGNVISANSTNLVVINQLKPIAVYFTLPENQLPQVLRRLTSDKRMPVDAYDRSDTQLLTKGSLLTADNQIDPTTGTGKLKAVFGNSDSVLFPNQFVNIHLVLENRANALVVPSSAIQTGLNGSLFVWTVNDDGKGGHVAQMQPVKVALAEGQNTILDSGPAPGTQVVVDGAERLRPGQPVSVGAAHPRQSGAQSSSEPAGATNGEPAAAGQPAPGAQPGSASAGQPGANRKSGQYRSSQSPTANQRQHQ
ncbi:MAG TPA: efflux RND transporter periplasmic adaptor subunit [Terracidiphilus sp.]|nr:efflux RND transporter periplasmic adaptor subunit [Terracidiphilus sp.]